MADLLYDHGLDEWRDWDTASFTWLALTSSYTPNKTHQFVDDVSTYEVSVGGYTRDAVVGATRTVDTSQHRVIYDCDDPDFGSLAAGETVAYVAIAKLITDDTDSLMMGLYDLANFATDGGQFSPVVAAAGVHYIDQAP